MTRTYEINRSNREGMFFHSSLGKNLNKLNFFFENIKMSEVK